MSNKVHNKRIHIGYPADNTVDDILVAYEEEGIFGTHQKVEPRNKEKGDSREMSKERNIAIFPGTFDPFTIGHLSIVERGLGLFDEIIIAIGINESKRSYFTVDQRIEMISNLFKDRPKVKVESYGILTVDYAVKKKAKYILRGIRSVNDFEYEKTIADVNRELSGVETIIFFTEPKYTHISSTIVRELIRYKKDVSGFVPKEIHIDSYIRKK